MTVSLSCPYAIQGGHHVVIIWTAMSGAIGGPNHPKTATASGDEEDSIKLKAIPKIFINDEEEGIGKK